MNISQRQQKILNILLKKEFFSSSEIFSELIALKEKISLVTIKRELSSMLSFNLIVATGQGRSRVYQISTSGRVFSETNAKDYCTIEPDKRYGLDRFNFNLFAEFSSEIFTQDELDSFTNATKKFKTRTKSLTPTIQKKELERLIIEFSWKSSKIEGNTYTLLDTEKLILENKEAIGHAKEEAIMILNHKKAFNFTRKHSSDFKTLTKTNLEQLHKILTKDSNITSGFRKNPIGVTGSKYRPLDNIYQIQEAVEALSLAISKQKTPYNKALLALLGISYIQPFQDGNKRTSRMIANAILLAHSLAPLSYRSVDENEYREATLVFYELNSIVPFKKIFIEQYEFSAGNYLVK